MEWLLVPKLWTAVVYHNESIYALYKIILRIVLHEKHIGKRLYFFPICCCPTCSVFPAIASGMWDWVCDGVDGKATSAHAPAAGDLRR